MYVFIFVLSIFVFFTNLCNVDYLSMYRIDLLLKFLDLFFDLNTIDISFNFYQQILQIECMSAFKITKINLNVTLT